MFFSGEDSRQYLNKRYRRFATYTTYFFHRSRQYHALQTINISPMLIRLFSENRIFASTLRQDFEAASLDEHDVQKF